MILTIGGASDTQIAYLGARLEVASRPFEQISLRGDSSPRLAWDLGSGDLVVDGRALQPSAVFLRFPDSGDPAQSSAAFFRSTTWYAVFIAWIMAHPEVRFMNRGSFGRPLYKPDVLVRARAAHLEVPETWITNDLSCMRALSLDDYVVKPVLGGLPCVTLAEALSSSPSLFRRGAAAAPAIVQRRLRGMEYRIYCVGHELFGYEIDCVDGSLVDYRTAVSGDQVSVRVWQSIPEGVKKGLRTMMDYYHLDFCAADFKTDPAKGGLHFLDLNDAPMFDTCDVLADHAMTKAVTRWLTAVPTVRTSYRPMTALFRAGDTAI